MIQFENHGKLQSGHSGAVAGEAFPRGTRVKRDSTGKKWVKCAEGEAGTGFSYHDVRALSTGWNIWNSSYDEGTPGAFDARRNFNKPFLANVGDKIAVDCDSGTVLRDFDLYFGTVAPEALLTSGPSAKLRAATAQEVIDGKACAKVLIGGTATYDGNGKFTGDTISIMSL